MKKMIALTVSVLCASIVFAVDFEPSFVSGFSVPASVVEMAKKSDRNFAAAKTAIEASQALDADLTDLADGSLTGTKVGTGISAANVTSGMLPPAVLTNAMTALMEQFIQSGTCTNGQTISFTPAFSSTPMVNGLFMGAPMDASGVVITNAMLYITSVSASSFVISCTTPSTNRIHWTAINVP